MSILNQSLWLIIFLSPLPAIAQLKCELPDTKGVASIRADGQVYLAVWRHSPRKDFLEIYYTGHCTDADRVASFDDPGIWWQSLSAIEDGAVVGFQVRATAGEGWYGATKLFMYDGKKFSKSYDSGEISEVTDLNGDGFPEVLEFLSEKGNPTGKVHIYVWRGNKFEMLTTVAADELYSAKVVARLKSGKLQSRKEDHHP